MDFYFLVYIGIPEFCASCWQTFAQRRTEIFVENSVAALFIGDSEFIHQYSRAITLKIL